MEAFSDHEGSSNDAGCSDTCIRLSSHQAHPHYESSSCLELRLQQTPRNTGQMDSLTNPVKHGTICCEHTPLQKSRYFKKSFWLSRNILQCNLSTVFILIFASTILHQVSGSCTEPTRFYSIDETAPRDTQIFTLPAPQDTTWSFEVTSEQAMDSYLSLTRDGDTFVMKLVTPIDLDDPDVRQDLGTSPTISIRLSCTDPEVSLNYLVTVVINAVNEYAPEFNTSSIQIRTDENVASSQILIHLINWASDRDYNFATREISRFEFEGLNVINGDNQYLQMAAYNGSVSAKETPGLDFEALPPNEKFVVAGVTVYDTGGLKGTSTLTVHVDDIDDLDPVFFYQGCDPCVPIYTVTVSPNYTGPLTDVMEPAPIQARDGDVLNYPIIYSLSNGPSGYEDYIGIDIQTAEVTVLKELSAFGVANIVFLVQATEDSILGRSTATSLLIRVDLNGVGAVGRSTGDMDDGLLVAIIILAIFVFICIVLLIIGLIVYRKKWMKKAVHPDGGTRPIVRDEEPRDSDNTARYLNDPSEARTLPVRLADEPMRGEEELIMWMPPKDLVDLSDDDNSKWKKKNGAPPMNTAITNRDSAFEESDKKSGSDESHDQYTETIYAKIMDSPPATRKDYNTKSSSGANNKNKGKPERSKEKRKAMPLPDPDAEMTNHVYKNQNRHTPGSSTLDSGLEDAEYVTPIDKAPVFHAPPPPPPVFYNPAFRHDDDDNDFAHQDDPFSDRAAAVLPEKKNNRRKNLRRMGTSGSDDDGEDDDDDDDGGGRFEGVTSFKGKTPKDRGGVEKYEDEDELAEYSIPPSNRSTFPGRPLPVPDDVQGGRTTSIDFDHGEYPTPPPRPKVKGQGSGMIIHEDGSTEDPYAKVEKRKGGSRRVPVGAGEDPSPLPPSAPNNKPTIVFMNGVNRSDAYDDHDNDSSADNSGPGTGQIGVPIQPPARRKRPRKRNKPTRSPEEDIYDGTKDYEDLEVDSGFYTDTTKTRIKRNNRVPVMRPDPNDTRYWITVTNDY